MLRFKEGLVKMWSNNDITAALFLDNENRWSHKLSHWRIGGVAIQYWVVVLNNLYISFLNLGEMMLFDEKKLQMVWVGTTTYSCYFFMPKTFQRRNNLCLASLSATLWSCEADSASCMKVTHKWYIHILYIYICMYYYSCCCCCWWWWWFCFSVCFLFYKRKLVSLDVAAGMLLMMFQSYVC